MDDGRFRRPRQHEPDTSAVRHARSDERSQRPYHRIARQGVLPRRSVGAGILHFLSRLAEKVWRTPLLKRRTPVTLPRRLVDVAQNVHHTRGRLLPRADGPQGMWIEAFRGSGKDEIIEKFEDRIIGKYVIDDVVNPATGENNLPRRHHDKRRPCQGNRQSRHRQAVYATRCLPAAANTAYAASATAPTWQRAKPVNLGEAVGVIAAQVHRRTGNTAYHENLPHRRRCYLRRHHARSSPRGGTVRSQKTQRVRRHMRSDTARRWFPPTSTKRWCRWWTPTASCLKSTPYPTPPE